jgi:acetyl-CoA carboxylase biotin carboxyl carrier protein
MADDRVWLTAEDVAEIVTILDGSPFNQLDLRTTRFRLRVAREQAGEWSQAWDWAEGAALPGAVATTTAVTEASLEDTSDGLARVTAALPGTFYRAPQPGAPAFVEPGDSVTAETVVGIVETMKLMNPVHAGVAGTVVAIPAANAVMVAAGTTLVRIRPA